MRSGIRTSGASGIVVAEGAVAGAVWFGGAMGLLDDAIREHLELKRRRGADPTEVARAERDALEPVFADEDADVEGEQTGEEDQPAEIAATTAEEHGGADPEQDPPTEQERFSTVGQETVELDMRTVMAQDADTVDAGETSAPPGASDWGFADGQPEAEPPEEVPGQERLTFE